MEAFVGENSVLSFRTIKVSIVLILICFVYCVPTLLFKSKTVRWQCETIYIYYHIFMASKKIKNFKLIFSGNFHSQLGRWSSLACSGDSNQGNSPVSHVGRSLPPRLGGSLRTWPDRCWTRNRRQTSLSSSRRFSMSANSSHHLCFQQETSDQQTGKCPITFFSISRVAYWMKS